MRAHRNKRLRWRAAVLISALSTANLAATGSAWAGFFDFLFGAPQQRSSPPAKVNAHARPFALAPRTWERSRWANGAGRFTAFCVRLCDGKHFPLGRLINATPVETCRAMCPASQTKVFFGGAIDRAVARDGALYSTLDNAYLYRDRLVPNCTCNGTDAFGLAPIGVTSDPTLHPGDVVSTKDGFAAFTGKRAGQVAEFTPAGPAVLAAEMRATPAPVRLDRRRPEPSVADEEPGIVLPRQSDVRLELRGQLDR